MHAPPQLGLDLAELRAQAFSSCLPLHRETSLPRLSTGVDKAEKLEGLWLPLSPRLPVLSGESPKFQQPRLVRVQC